MSPDEGAALFLALGECAVLSRVLSPLRFMGQAPPLARFRAAAGPPATDPRERTTHKATGRLLDQLMKIKLDRMLFLVGVSLLVIGVGTSVVVIVVATISFVLKLLG